MRVSQFGLTTLKEVPAEAEIVSHKLMLRAGLIRRLTSGIFTWMPIGLRVLRKVEAIVREEMNSVRRTGAADAGGPARRTVAGKWSLGQVRSPVAAHERPPRARVLLRPHARRGHHRHRTPRTEKLQATAGEFLSDSDQISRRNPAAFRRNALARVHHERRLLVRSGSTGPGGLLSEDACGLYRDLRAAGTDVSRR